MANLVEDLSVVKAAAEIQVSSISALVKELVAGMDRLLCELSVCKQHGRDEAFVTAVSRFVTDNEDECRSLVACEEECLQQLAELCGYFDEKFEAAQPNKVLVTLRDFLASLAKAFRDNSKAKATRR